MQRKIVDKPDKYDLGNNFIKKGSGLNRTPPRARPDGFISPEDSPMSNSEMPRIEVGRAFLEPTAIEVTNEDPSPISWPSKGPSKQSPMGSA